MAGLVIETARDGPDVTCTGEAVERLIDGVARAEVDEINRRPDSEGRVVRHALCDGGLEIEPWAAHGNRLFVRKTCTCF